MTVPSETNRSGPYNGNGVTTVFDYGFRILDEDHLRVIKKSALGTETVLVIDTDYTVSDVGEPAGGSVTLDEAPEAGETITILRSIPFVQETDLENQGAYYAETVEDALDLAAMRDQQLDEGLARTLQMPPSYGGDVNPTLPVPVANKLIGWNEAADGLQNMDASTLASIVAYGTANADIFTGDGVETEFALSDDPAAINNLDVAIGGVTQLPGVDYTWSSGTTLTFTTAPANGVTILVRYMQALAQGTTNADLVLTPDGTAQAALNARAVTVATRAAMKALNVTRHTVAFLNESGRQGTFMLVSGSAPADSLEGLYVVSDTPGYYWSRLWDGRTGYPEWFDESGGADFLAALEECIQLCPVTSLGARDYPISDTWVIQSENRTVKGTSRFNRTAGAGPRITMADADKDIIFVGYASQPSGAPEQDASGAGFLKNVTLEDFAICRTVAPSPWGDITDPTSVGAGLRVQYVLKCNFRRLLVQDGALGVYAGGTIYTKFDDVEARIDRNTSAGNQDTCRGWYLDGNRGFGYAGGNASIYINRCVGVGGRKNGSTIDANIPVGMVAKGSFVDSFIDNFEVAGTSKGMVIDGTGASAFGTVDLEIFHPVIDQYDTLGIEINNIGQAAIELIAPYIAWNGAGNAGLLLSTGSGVTVLGGQIIGGSGLSCASLSNSVIDGLKLRECSAPVQLTDCDSLKVVVQCNNRSAAATQAVNMTNCARCKVEPLVIAASAAPTNFTYGINLASGNTNCTLDVTGVANGATSDRIRTGGGGGSGIATQGDVSGHVIINPGAGAML